MKGTSSGKTGRSLPRWGLPAVLSILWGLGVWTGLRSMWAYENAPGRVGEPPARLAALPEREGPSGKPVLVLIAHPRCPCTRASIEELAQIVAACHGPLQVRVLFFRPAGAPDGWARTELWRRAAAIPGVEVLADAGGRAARRFGAETSGHAVLYGADGDRLFSGGITPARGHAGESAGRRAILSLLAGGTAGQETAPVYGCSLRDPVSEEAAKEAGVWKRS